MTRNNIYATVVMMLVSLVSLSGRAQKGEFDWPRWRGPEGDGISLETDWNPEALAGDPAIVWKQNIGMGYSNVVIKDNHLYTMGSTEDGTTVTCLEADTGREIWRFPFEGRFETNSTPTTDGEFVYAINNDGILVCLQARNGKLRWKRDLVSECGLVNTFYGYGASPVIEGDLILLTANTSGLALNKKTGEVVWDSEKPPENADWRGRSTGTDYSTPVAYDYEGKRYAVLSSYVGIHGVDIETGQLLWLYKWEDFILHVTDPLIFDNKVLLTRFKAGGSILLDIGGGVAEVLWKNKNMSSDIGSPVLIDGYIYGVEGGVEMHRCFLRCISAESGELMWEEDLGKEAVSLIGAASKLIILEDNGTLHIAQASPISYQEISSCDVLEGKKTKRLFWTCPVLCNGKIYCRNTVGQLICIDMSK